jgi:hypothetical protein
MVVGKERKEHNNNKGNALFFIPFQFSGDRLFLAVSFHKIDLLFFGQGEAEHTDKRATATKNAPSKN